MGSVPEPKNESVTVFMGHRVWLFRLYIRVPWRRSAWLLVAYKSVFPERTNEVCKLAEHGTHACGLQRREIWMNELAATLPRTVEMCESVQLFKHLTLSTQLKQVVTQLLLW